MEVYNQTANFFAERSELMRDRVSEEIRQKLAHELEVQKQMEQENEIDLAWAKPYAYILAILVVIAAIIYVY